MINPRSIEEVKDILLAMASRIDLWDGTWEQNSYTEPLSSDDGFWYGLTYKKRFGRRLRTRLTGFCINATRCALGK